MVVVVTSSSIVSMSNKVEWIVVSLMEVSVVALFGSMNIFIFNSTCSIVPEFEEINSSNSVSFDIEVFPFGSSIVPPISVEVSRNVFSSLDGINDFPREVFW